MKVMSLFSGVGGFDLAFKRLGHEIVGACEIDEYARQIYAKHFPGVFIYKDARKIDPAYLPAFDILVAGFPCQAFSVAGKRGGFNDTRGTLFFEIARIAQEKRPRYLFLENVKGLLSHARGDTFRKILKTLDELGYDTESHIVNSKDFVPQNRERIFIIGTLRGGSRREILPITENIRKTNTLKKVGHIDTKGHNSLWGRVYDPESIASTLNARGGGLGAKTGLYIVADRSRSYAGKGRNLESPKEYCNSITSVPKDNLVLRGKRIRRLIPLECERLQGFPEDWTKSGSDKNRYECCGNAVTVPVVEFIIRNMLRDNE